MFKHWAVRTKMLAGFGIMLLLMITMTSAALYWLAAVRHDLDDIALNRYPKIVMIDDVIKASLDNGSQIRSAILTSDNAAIENALGQMDKNQSTINDRVNQLDQTVISVKGKKLLAEIHTGLDRLNANYPQMKQYALSHNSAEFVALLQQSFVPANNQTWQALEALNQFQRQQMDKARNNASQSASTAVNTVVVLLLLACVLAILIALGIATRVARPLHQAVALVERIQQGDLRGTEEAPEPSKDETLTLMRHLLLMRQSLRELIESIQQSAHDVSGSADSLSSMAKEVSNTASKQSQATNSAAATIEQLTVSINHVADNSTEAARLAHAAGNTAHQGSVDVGLAAQRIHSVSDSVGQTSDKILELSQHVTAIGDIVTDISEVADQTNLLALNAAIEAARAGEMGRGFAVVADEVRKLAERTTVSAREIAEKITTIQHGADLAVDSMAQSHQSVNEVRDNAAQSIQSMQQIEQSSSGVVGSIESINAALNQQRIASTDLAQRMEQVAQMSEETSSTVNTLADTSRQMTTLSQQLQTVAQKFTLA